jgi:hypothetical protein
MMSCSVRPDIGQSRLGIAMGRSPLSKFSQFRGTREWNLVGFIVDALRRDL